MKQFNVNQKARTDAVNRVYNDILETITNLVERGYSQFTLQFRLPFRGGYLILDKLSEHGVKCIPGRFIECMNGNDWVFSSTLSIDGGN